MTPEQIASVCHVALSRYYREFGIITNSDWPDETWQNKQALIAMIVRVLEHPYRLPSQHHANWIAKMETDGWSYGEAFDEESKKHPYLIPYNDMLLVHRKGDNLLRNIVLALTQGDENV